MMKIIIGLGNPGKEYAVTRHNAGFMAVDALAEKLGLEWSANKKLKCELIKTSDFILVKPLTYMNESGRSVSAVAEYFKIIPKKVGMIHKKDADLSEIITVIHDDLDIPLGKVKSSVDSRSAGHNGVQSIIDHLKTKNFKRIRIGINTPEAEIIPAEKFVLAKFKKEELMIINKMVEKIIKELT